MQAYKRNQHTLTIGTIAPEPLWSLAPLLMKQYPEMNISTEINVKDKRKTDKQCLSAIVTMIPQKHFLLILLPFLF